MYAKIFESIYDGSLRKDWKALVVFQQLLILCDAEGIIHKTPEAIAARTGIPLEFICHGLQILSQPDPQSRSREMEGRRIVLIDVHVDWGWTVINYESYRNIKTTEELRAYWSGKQREHRAETLSEKTDDLKRAVGVLFKRNPEDNWSYLEQSMLSEVARRSRAMQELEEIKEFRRKAGKYFPQSIVKLLENWNPLIDRARNGVATRRGPNI